MEGATDFSFSGGFSVGVSLSFTHSLSLTLSLSLTHSLTHSHTHTHTHTHTHPHTLQERQAAAGGGHCFSSSTVMHYSSDGRGGQPHVYQATSSTRQAPGGVRRRERVREKKQRGGREGKVGGVQNMREDGCAGSL